MTDNICYHKFMKLKKRRSWLVIGGVVSILLNVILLLKQFQIPKIFNQNREKARVTKVIDGDTFDVEGGERIRLYEINAPEYPKDCMGVDAKARLEDLLLKKSVSIEKIKKDNFGRIVALVYYDKLLINEILTEEGLAYFEKSNLLSSSSLIIEKAEEKARSAGRGVWSSLCQTKKDGCVIKGNYRPADNTRIYHTTDCYNYNRITIKPGTSDRWFCTEDEAQLAGFRKSMDCP